jgi:quinol monooxygenase YgiN
MKQPVKMHVTYRPKPGKEEELLALIRKHGPALQSTGLIVGGPAVIYRATDKRSGEKFFIETFAWRDEDAPEAAHQMPEVMAVWEPMTPILAGMQLAVVEELSAQA